MDGQSGHDPAFNSSMRSLSRLHVAEIWRKGQAGEPLHGEDAVYYQVMMQHPEYQEIWESVSQLSNRDTEVDGVNPFMHIAMHSVVESQIAANQPPETAQTLFRLTKSGMDRHEAMHRIAHIFTELLWQVLHDKKPFDEQAYRRRLRAAKP